MCGSEGPFALVHRCARPACSSGRCQLPLGACSPVRAPGVFCVRCSWPLCSCLPVRTLGLLCVQCLSPLGSCSSVCPLGVLCCVCGVLGNLAPVHSCTRLVCCVALAVSLATFLLFTGVPALCIVLCVRCAWPMGSCSRVCTPSVMCMPCPWPLGSCSPMCSLGVLCGACRVVGLLALVHLCARRLCCVACALFWANCLLFTGVPPRCAACVVSLATLLLFTGVPARCVMLRERFSRPLGSRSPVCPSVCCLACAVSWANWHLT